MNFKAAPLYRGDQNGSRSDVVGEVLEFSEQVRNRILELLDIVPRRHLGTFQECSLERRRFFADPFERRADLDRTRGRLRGRR